MKSFLLSLTALPLALTIVNPAAYASTLDLTLQTGAIADVFSGPTSVIFDGVSAEEYTYTHQTDCVLGLGGCSSVLGSTTSVFTAIVADVSPVLTVVNVNDVCTDVVVLGSAPGCQSFAFSATDVVLGDGLTGIGAAAGVLALADVNLGVGFAGLNIDGATDGPQILGLGVNGASDQFNFTPPPVAATPEPGSLYLLGTGLATAAGIARRKYLAGLNA